MITRVPFQWGNANFAWETEYKETKEVVDRQIRITDVALVAKEVLGINIKIDL